MTSKFRYILYLNFDVNVLKSTLFLLGGQIYVCVILSVFFILHWYRHKVKTAFHSKSPVACDYVITLHSQSSTVSDSLKYCE